MKKRARRTASIFLTLFLGAASLRAQPAQPPEQQPGQAPGQGQRQPPLKGYKLAVLVIEPPSYWTKKQRAQSGWNPKTPADDGWSTMGSEEARLRFSAAVSLAQQFKHMGADVQVVFMGPAVLWLATDDVGMKGGKDLGGPHTSIARLKAAGVAVSADSWASKAFDVESKVTDSAPYFGSQGGPPGPINLAAQGYHIVVF